MLARTARGAPSESEVQTLLARYVDFDSQTGGVRSGPEGDPLQHHLSPLRQSQDAMEVDNGVNAVPQGVPMEQDDIVILSDGESEDGGPFVWSDEAVPLRMDLARNMTATLQGNEGPGAVTEHAMIPTTQGSIHDNTIVLAPHSDRADLPRTAAQAGVDDEIPPEANDTVLAVTASQTRVDNDIILLSPDSDHADLPIAAALVGDHDDIIVLPPDSDDADLPRAVTAAQAGVNDEMPPESNDTVLAVTASPTRVDDNIILLSADSNHAELPMAAAQVHVDDDIIVLPPDSDDKKPTVVTASQAGVDEDSMVLPPRSKKTYGTKDQPSAVADVVVRSGSDDTDMGFEVTDPQGWMRAYLRAGVNTGGDKQQVHSRRTETPMVVPEGDITLSENVTGFDAAYTGEQRLSPILSTVEEVDWTEDVAVAEDMATTAGESPMIIEGEEPTAIRGDVRRTTFFGDIRAPEIAFDVMGDLGSFVYREHRSWEYVHDACNHLADTVSPFDTRAWIAYNDSLVKAGEEAELLGEYHGL